MEYLSNQELELLRGFVGESLSQKGTPALFFPIKVKTKDVYEDSTLEFDTPRSIHVIPESQVDMRTLNSLGWFAEDTDSMPFLVSIPFYDDDGVAIPMREECKVVFPYEVDGRQEREFLIYKAIAHNERPYFYKCNLIPVRPVAVEAQEESETGQFFTSL